MSAGRAALDRLGPRGDRAGVSLQGWTVPEEQAMPVPKSLICPVCGEANPATLVYCKVCEAKLDHVPQPRGKRRRYKEKVADERRFVRFGVILALVAVGALIYWLVGVFSKPLTSIQKTYHSKLLEGDSDR